MSAWMCSNNHLSALANEMESIGPKGAEYYFKMLCEQNKASLRARYSDPDDMFNDKDEFIPTAQFASVVEAIKNCHCYAYQSNEDDGWEKSEAKQCIDALESSLIYKLPDYDKAPWGI